MDKLTDKIHSSSSDSDSDKKKVKFDDVKKKKEHDAPVMTSSIKSKRLFGREKPVHQVFGGVDIKTSANGLVGLSTTERRLTDADGATLLVVRRLGVLRFAN
ncbi:reticulon [Artemisia annua]|uniref:Reticulon n=1 Tax=Artemisia annua TaxID=35608 RepID=A0A2U1LIL2_ARTAN|nr:reticulon [Artemisia annua]